MADTRSLHAMHSWIGVVLGLFVYTVCFTGVASLFVDELVVWDMREYQLLSNADPYSDIRQFELSQIDRAMAEVAKTNELRGKNVYITLPSKTLPFTSFSVSGLDKTLRYSSGTGVNQIEQYHPKLSNTLRRIHTELMLPLPIGRYLVGLAGIIMLVSILSGVIIHRRIFTEMFAFRPYKSLRLLITDSHKNMSVWGLVFHTTISFTGAIVGLGGLLILLSAGAAYKGDTEAAMNAVLGAHPTESKEYTSGVAMSQLIDSADALWKDDSNNRGHDFLPVSLDVHFYEDNNSTVVVNYKTPGYLNNGNAYEFHGITGDFIERKSNIDRSAGLRFYSAITPLHYATFGGVGLKILYGLMGMCSALLVVSGIMIWQERQIKRNLHKFFGFIVLSRLVFSLPVGLLMATLLVFPLSKLPIHEVTNALIVNIYLGVLALVVFVGSWVKQPRQILRLVFGFCAAVCCITIVVSMLSGDYWQGVIIEDVPAIYGVDLAFCLLSGVFLCLAKCFPKRASI